MSELPLEELEPLQLEITPEQAGMRLDRAIVALVPDLSRSTIQRLLDEGAILVHERPAKPSQIVKAGDTFTVIMPEAQPIDLIPEAIPLDIIYEDDDIVVVNKAAGMVVHPAPGHARGTLVNALLAHYPHMQIGGDLRPGIVHRLDRDTSGLLVVARNDATLRLLTEQQKERRMHKAYLALVHGRLREPTGTIDAPLGRHPSDRLRQAIVQSGRTARTHYRVLEELGDFSLVEAVLETGRTHQIRVHFASLHRYVAGDPLYTPKSAKAPAGLKRQFLHAYKLGLNIPSDGTWREFSAPLPEDLAQVLARLQKTQTMPDMYPASSQVE